MKRYRLISWSEKWQMYTYTTCRLEGNFEVGYTFWKNDVRYEVIEVLD